jgi:hypothetical protein
MKFHRVGLCQLAGLLLYSSALDLLDVFAALSDFRAALAILINIEMFGLEDKTGLALAS